MAKQNVVSGPSALSPSSVPPWKCAGSKLAAVVLAIVLWAPPYVASPATVQGQSVSFVARRDFGAGSFPSSVAAGDFNGDGILDLAVANYASRNVSLLLGNGDGTFQAAQNFDAGSGPTSVAAGDFNGDGILDLAVADFPSNKVSVLLGNGDGTFQ